MKKVITSNIAGSTGQPVKSGTLAHIQSAYKEAFQIMMQNLYGITATDTTVRVLYGCVNSGGSTIGTTCNISAGAVYYNGELYFVPAASFLIATGLVAVISTVTNSTNFFVDATADPVTMTDLSTPYVHSQFQVTIVDGNSGTTGFIANYSAFGNMFSAWQSVTYAGSYASGTSGLKYRKEGNNVRFKGEVIATAPVTKTATDAVIAAIPAIYRPLAIHETIVNAHSGAGATAPLQILTTGVLQLRADITALFSTQLAIGFGFDIGAAAGQGFYVDFTYPLD